jgi:hypothetical protein
MGSSSIKTIQDILVLKMVYLDMFFLFLGREKMKTPGNAAGDMNEYFYLTKSL